MKFFSEIVDNVILSEVVKDGSYHVEIKQPRNIKFHRKYWKLIEFTLHHLPEKFNYTVSLMGVNVAEVAINNKDTLHCLFKYLLGVESISFASMSESDFKEFYGRSLDICCRLLGTSEETVIKELTHYF